MFLEIPVDKYVRAVSVPSEIICIKSVFFFLLVHMQFPIEDHYIHMSGH